MSAPVILTAGDVARFYVDGDRDKHADGDPGLVCEWCGVVLCTIEDGDTLSTLIRTALDHDCEDES